MTEDIFARSLHGELRELAHTAHPSFAQLLSYAQHERTEWVSAHVVTCGQCQQELHKIRVELAALEEALPQLAPRPAPSLVERLKTLWQGWSQKLLPRPVFYGHVVAYATAALLLVLLNLGQLQISAEPGLQGGGAGWWVQWPLLVWAALLLWHGYRVWRR
jgi:hypothetical protein